MNPILVAVFVTAAVLVLLGAGLILAVGRGSRMEDDPDYVEYLTARRRREGP